MSGVFVALVEVASRPGGLFDPHEVAGAMVRAYVVAGDEAAAVRAVEAALEEDGCELVAVEWCVADAEAGGENPAELRYVEEAAKASGEVVFGRFDVWPPEPDRSVRPTPIDDDYAACGATFATLLIRTPPAVPPSVVTELLDLEPTRTRMVATASVWELSTQDEL